jgi:dihydrolipoamide dehydrogenase
MAARDSLDTRLAVIGGGPGGYAAAFHAADLGLAPLLIDPQPDPGGVCLYHGCIPSKALLHVAKRIEEARAVSAWGVRFGEPEIDLERLRAAKDEVVATLTRGLGQLRDRRHVEHLRGRARFDGPRALSVETASGETRRVRFEQAIVATGSQPARVRGFPAGEPRLWDSTRALALDCLPARLLVVGGGYIGLELGQVYAALGSRVSVVEMTASILPGVDADLVRPLAARLARTFETVMTETTVTRLEPEAQGLRATLEGRTRESQQFDRVLVAVGRRPALGELGLETTAVGVGRDGFIEVDRQRRTAEPSIYAIGDATGEPLLAHKATAEGRVAVEAIAGRPVAFEPAAIPAVVFTDPEIAWCGLSESEAGRRGRRVAISRFPWAASGRARTLGRDDGLTKLVLDPETERVLGVGLVGPGAGELIGEATLAVEMAALARDLALTIHPHPTLSETLMEAAEAASGHATHVLRPARR